MRKLKLLLMTSLLVIGMTGCNTSQDDKQEEVVSTTYTKAVEEGKLAIADSDYIKASNMFSLALEEKQDEEIANLNKQCKSMAEIGIMLDENENVSDEEAMSSLEKMLVLCGEIIEIDTKSNLVKDKAKELKSELEKIKNEYNSENEKENTVNTKENKENTSKKDEYIQKLNRIEQEVSGISYDGSTVEMKEASSKVLKKWDDALNEIYGVLKSQLSSSEMEAVKMEQREWIAIRDAGAEQAASEYEGGSMAGLEYSETLVRFTRERCYELVELYMK